MKKILSVLLVLVVLAGCSSTKENYEEISGNKLASVSVMGKPLSLNQAFQVEDYEKPDDIYQGDSCGFDGFDHIFTYNDMYVIYTYPVKEVNYVSEIEILPQGSTESGLKLGSSVDDLEAKYGIEYQESGSYRIYAFDEYELEVSISDNKIEAMSLLFTRQ